MRRRRRRGRVGNRCRPPYKRAVELRRYIVGGGVFGKEGVEVGFRAFRLLVNTVIRDRRWIYQS